MKKIIIAGLDFGVNNYFTNHIDVLSSRYEVKKVCFDKISWMSPFFRRRSFITLPIEIFLFWCYLLIVRPSYVISVGPKIGLICSICCFFSKSKNLHWFTGQVWANNKKPKLSAYYWLDYIILKLSYKVFCDGKSQSGFLRDKMVGAPFISFPSCGSINGIRDEFYQNTITEPKGDNFTISFIGRKANDKGFPIILSLIKCLDPKKFNFILAGPVETLKSDEYLSLKKWCSQESVSNVKLVDCLVDPVSILTESTVLLLPSRREGFGSIAVEAQALGVPIICSNIYGLKDAFINMKTGISCDSVEEYIEAIEYLSIYENYISFSENAVSFSKKFERLAFCKILNRLYIDNGL